MRGIPWKLSANKHTERQQKTSWNKSPVEYRFRRLPQGFFVLIYFWLTLPMDFFNSPNRFVPDSKSRIMSTFHLSLMSVSVVSTGQAGKILASIIASSCLLVSKSSVHPYFIVSPLLGSRCKSFFLFIESQNPFYRIVIFINTDERHGDSKSPCLFLMIHRLHIGR